jgi:predicted flap endonuclease-1-like 5' DNA nuclease
MNYLLSQIFLCLLAAFILGLIIGWLLKRLACKKCEDELQQLRQQITTLKNRKPELVQEQEQEQEPPAKIETLMSNEKIVTEIKRDEKESQQTDIDPADAFKPIFLSEPRNGKADDLKRIKGVGKVLEDTLNALGIFHFDQIADWSDDNVSWMDTFMKFPGRIEREGWVDQATLLAHGGETAFSKKVDKNKIYD